ncbi:MAG: hypothetical protein JKY95_16455 [Planctomycetaceae bacterium]|nr:hypothetical protein [Planctomycetaceae bacterium]
MATKNTRMVWFTCGVLGGLMVSYFWPHEMAFADTDRDAGGSKFAVVTVNTGVTTGDAIFVLDFLTGRLYGAALNAQTGKFNQFYARNIMNDFKLSPDAKPRFVVTSARLNISARGARKQPATHGLVISELNSGMVMTYAFPFSLDPRNEAIETLTPVDGFQFRQGVQ